MADSPKRSNAGSPEIELDGRQLTLEDWAQMLKEDAMSLEADSRGRHQATVWSPATANDTPAPHRRERNPLNPVAPPRKSSTTASLLSPEEVAGRCGLSRKAVYRAVARGELRAARILSRLRIDPRDVDAWIQANVVDAATPTRAPLPTRYRLPAAPGLRRLLPEP